MTNWNEEARVILKAELVRKELRYKDLARMLKEIGVPETQSSITNKLARGTFSFAFFLQCMRAIDKTTVTIDMKEIP